MKHIYSFVSTLLLATSLSAQFTTITFDDLPLTGIDTFYVGSDSAGGFTAEGVTFKNSYAEYPWGFSWGGFGYSNMTDNVTTGFGNQFSAITGAGAQNSDIYAIYTNSDTLFFPGAAVFGTVQVTNTTYAYYAVKDGDDGNATPFVKGPFEEGDFFTVTIYGHSSSDELVDSIVVYLADYRSTNTSDHYVLNDWTSINLETLEGSTYLTFKFDSSDIGAWGMNTPAYFALDNLEYNLFVNALENQQNIQVSIHPNPTRDFITITIPDEAVVSVYNSTGQLIQNSDISQTGIVHLSSYDAGLYILHIHTSSGNVVRRIVKQ